MWCSTWRFALLAASFMGIVQARLPHRGMELPGKDLTAPTDDIHVAYFRQILDHQNPQLGTFSQRYWWSTRYWKGPGSPVVMLNAGEADAAPYTHYCTNETITGMIAQAIGAATIVLEHRYWGKSSPFSELTTANLTYLTLENNIHDMTHFARTVNLSFAIAHPSNAADVPWILVGGSYPGALTAYTANVAPGTFWAYLASSAPVQVISNFWEYYAPIQAGMPKNCSRNVNQVIDYMDNVLMNGSAKEMVDLKTKFGLQSYQENNAFMAVLQQGPWLWQTNNDTWISGFWEWCDYIENSVNASKATLPGPRGVSLPKALDGYAAWVKALLARTLDSAESSLPYSDQGAAHYHDSNFADNAKYTNVSVNNPVNRQWLWMLCNTPFGFWQNGAPTGTPTLVSRLITVAFNVEACAYYFPTGPQGQTYGIAKGATETEVNAYTGGWHIVNTTRLIYTNGEFDPWRPASVSSQTRPGGPLVSSEQVPVHLIPGGVHCYDFLAKSGKANAAVAAVQQAEIAQLVEWVKEWPKPYL